MSKIREKAFKGTWDYSEGEKISIITHQVLHRECDDHAPSF